MFSKSLFKQDKVLWNLSLLKMIMQISFYDYSAFELHHETEEETATPPMLVEVRSKDIPLALSSKFIHDRSHCHYHCQVNIPV